MCGCSVPPTPSMRRRIDGVRADVETDDVARSQRASAVELSLSTLAVKGNTVTTSGPGVGAVQWLLCDDGGGSRRTRASYAAHVQGSGDTG